MVDFLTVEDINSVVAEYYNTPFWDNVIIDTGSTDNFSNLYFDYMKVSRSHNTNYVFTILPENSLKTGQYYFIDSEGNWLANVTENNGTITVVSPTPVITVYCQLFVQSTSQNTFNNVEWIVENVSPRIAYKTTSINVTVSLEEVNPNFTVDGKTFNVNGASVVCSNKELTFDLPYNEGYNCIIGYNGVSVPVFIYSNIKNMNIVDIPTDLTLIVGRSNSFSFISDSSNLSVVSDYPVTVNGKEVTVDLTDKTDIKPFNIIVSTNEDSDYYSSQSQFRVQCDYSTITDLSGLTSLFSQGGVGRLGANITLSTDLVLNKDVSILGNEKTIDLNNHKLIISSDKSFKADNTIFTNGVNSIQQNINTKVELTNCDFTGCTGLGSVIDCQVDITSLDNPTDFTTNLTGCSISDCDMAILHGGDLTIENCKITAKIGDKKYPYFLYQTDGDAVILKSDFTIANDSSIPSDLEFNTCIFVCGENAQVNGLSHSELTSNNINSFLEVPQNNASKVDLTYYYDLISDYIVLKSTKGFCHGVSGSDFIFKTNVKPVRSE